MLETWYNCEMVIVVCGSVGMTGIELQVQLVETHIARLQSREEHVGRQAADQAGNESVEGHIVVWEPSNGWPSSISCWSPAVNMPRPVP